MSVTSFPSRVIKRPLKNMFFRIYYLTSARQHQKSTDSENNKSGKTMFLRLDKNCDNSNQDSKSQAFIFILFL